MSKAILDGRKTQTRRVVKLPDDLATVVGRNAGGELDSDAPRDIPEWQLEKLIASCPYGRVGDRMWVREPWAIEDETKLAIALHEGGQNPDWIYYRDPVHENTGLRWRPSIFMPRWASRITLEITGVRIELLWEISEKDAREEGAAFVLGSRDGRSHDHDTKAWCRWTKILDPAATIVTNRGAFAAIWDRINGKSHPWDSNPLVRCIEFNRFTPPGTSPDG